MFQKPGFGMTVWGRICHLKKEYSSISFFSSLYLIWHVFSSCHAFFTLSDNPFTWHAILLLVMPTKEASIWDLLAIYFIGWSSIIILIKQQVKNIVCQTNLLKFGQDYKRSWLMLSAGLHKVCILTPCCASSLLF